MTCTICREIKNQKKNCENDKRTLRDSVYPAHHAVIAPLVYLASKQTMMGGIAATLPSKASYLHSPPNSTPEPSTSQSRLQPEQVAELGRSGWLHHGESLSPNSTFFFFFFFFFSFKFTQKHAAPSQTNPWNIRQGQQRRQR